MISLEDLQQRRSPSALREFVDGLFEAVRGNISELHRGLLKKGLYKEFLDEIVPLSRFAAETYPEAYYVQPVLGNQGYDALVFDETGAEVDRVEMTKPHDGAAGATDAKLVVKQGYGEFRVQNVGDDISALIPIVARACESKAQKDYGGCTLVVAIDIQPPFEGFEVLYEEQIRTLIDRLNQIKFRAKRVFLLIMPSRIQALNGLPMSRADTQT